MSVQETRRLTRLQENKRHMSMQENRRHVNLQQARRHMSMQENRRQMNLQQERIRHGSFQTGNMRQGSLQDDRFRQGSFQAGGIPSRRSSNTSSAREISIGAVPLNASRRTSRNPSAGTIPGFPSTYEPYGSRRTSRQRDQPRKLDLSKSKDRGLVMSRMHFESGDPVMAYDQDIQVWEEGHVVSRSGNTYTVQVGPASKIFHRHELRDPMEFAGKVVEDIPIPSMGQPPRMPVHTEDSYYSDAYDDHDDISELPSPYELPSAKRLPGYAPANAEVVLMHVGPNQQDQETAGLTPKTYLGDRIRRYPGVQIGRQVDDSASDTTYI